MMSGIAVAEQWRRYHLDTFGSLIDEEQGVIALLWQLRLKPEEVSEIGAGHVPFFAIQNVIVA